MLMGTFSGRKFMLAKETNSQDPSFKPGMGGYLITGTVYHIMARNVKKTDILLVKIDSEGEVKWARVYGGNGYEDGFSAVETADGGFAVVGMSSSFS